MKKPVPVPQVTFRTVDMTALVNKLDPTRLVRPEVVYNTRRPKTERPDQPGATYRWVTDNDD